MAVVHAEIWGAQQQEYVRKLFEQMPVEVGFSLPADMAIDVLIGPDILLSLWTRDFESTCKLIKALEDQGLRLTKVDCLVNAGIERGGEPFSPCVTFVRVPSQDKAYLDLGFGYKNGGLNGISH